MVNTGTAPLSVNVFHCRQNMREGDSLFLTCATGIAIQPYGGFIDSLCLYKYLSVAYIYRNKQLSYCS